MGKEIYIVNCYTCQHNGQETCKGCNTLLNGDVEPYENWELREDLSQKDQRIAELEQKLAELKQTYNKANEKLKNITEELENNFVDGQELNDLREEKDKLIYELEKELDEIKEKAIVPKFKIGQEVYYYHIARNKIYLGLVEDIQYFATRSGIFYRIPNLQRDYFWIREDELFATEQEAQDKLKEIQGNE